MLYSCAGDWAVPCPPNDNSNNNQNARQPGLGACGASLSSPGRLVLSNLIGAGNRQMVNVRQDHVAPVGLFKWFHQ